MSSHHRDGIDSTQAVTVTHQPVSVPPLSSSCSHQQNWAAQNAEDFLPPEYLHFSRFVVLVPSQNRKVRLQATRSRHQRTGLFSVKVGGHKRKNIHYDESMSRRFLPISQSSQFQFPHSIRVDLLPVNRVIVFVYSIEHVEQCNALKFSTLDYFDTLSKDYQRKLSKRNTSTGSTSSVSSNDSKFQSDHSDDEPGVITAPTGHCYSTAEKQFEMSSTDVQYTQPLDNSTLDIWRNLGSVSLSHQNIRVESVQTEHFDGLFAAGGQDPEIARYFPPSVPVIYSSPEHMRTFFEARIKNNAHTFVIFCDDTIVGSYSYLDMQPQHRSLEIGAIWLAKSARGRGINHIVVRLLLQFAFETLKCIRVWWKTDSRNDISRKTALKMGATQEGILRSHMIMRDGYRRDSVVFSWLDTEWKQTQLQFNTV